MIMSTKLALHYVLLSYRTLLSQSWWFLWYASIFTHLCLHHHFRAFAVFYFFVIRARSICPRCTAAYRLIVRPLSPPWFLDVPTSTARCLHVHTTQEILAAKGGTVGENVGR